MISREAHFVTRTPVGILLLAVFCLVPIGCGGDTQQSQEKPQPSPQPALSQPSLQADLDALKLQFSETAPPEMVNTFERGVIEVAESGVLETALTEGDKAPMFSLPNAVGNPVSLDSLLGSGPVVLVWYRGGWCPYCNLQLNAMQDILPRIRELGATLVAISPELPDSSLSTKQKSSLEYVVLSDRGNSVARQFGIVYTIPAGVKDAFAGRLDIPAYNGDTSWELPLAVTYVVDAEGVIRYAFVDPDYRRRAEPAEIILALERLSGGA